MTAPLVAMLRHQDGAPVLLAPKLGVFQPALHPGAHVGPGTVLGHLSVLHRRYAVLAPEGAHGIVVQGGVAGPRQGVPWGAVLVVLGEAAASFAGTTDPGATAAGGDGALAGAGLLLRAPIHGIFYRRPSPADPPYVEVGTRVSRGQCVGLVEVMKSFHPVAWSGPDGRVAAILIEDLAEVAHGQALLRVVTAPVE